MGQCQCLSYKKSKRHFQESNGEYLSRCILEKHFKKRFPNLRLDFIRNPKTNRKLELDGYNKKLGIAFEFNGIQHYRCIKRFHKEQQDFINQQYRDKIKQQKCNEYGIHLIIIPYNEKNVKEYIIKHLPEKDLKKILKRRRRRMKTKSLS